MGRIIAVLVVCLALAGCGGGASSQASEPNSTTSKVAAAPVLGGWGNQVGATVPIPTATVSSPVGLSTAEVAQKYISDNMGGGLSSDPLWGRYVVGYSYDAGVLRVNLQVDRQSPEGQEAGKSAAHAIANFIMLGDPPTQLKQINWVEATDGAGTHIAQNPVH